MSTIALEVAFAYLDARENKPLARPTGVWGKGDGELDSQAEILVLVQHLKHGKPWKNIMKAYLCWD
jgi:hypothetical protein